MTIKDVETWIKSAKEGNIEEIKRLWNEKIITNINVIDSDSSFDWTALIWAGLRKNFTMMQFLLDNGADINYISPIKDSFPLNTFVELGVPEAVEFALKHGAIVNLRKEDSTNYQGMHTPLQIACQMKGGVLESIKLLVKYGADIEVRTKQGLTPIMSAFSSKNEDAIDYLISVGADIHAIDDDEDNLLHYAVRLGNMKYLQKLIAMKLNINRENYINRTPLMTATMMDNLKIVKFLLLCGADPTLRDSIGKNAYEMSKSWEIQRLLKSWGKPGEDEI